MYEQYADKQIVEMLIPKLNKATGHDWNDLFEYPKVCADMIEAISLAYRSGYVRGQLGRSFIIGGKKADEKKVKKSVNTFKVGNKVKFLGFGVEDEEALSNRHYYPPVNTVGEVVEVLSPEYCFVQWPKGAIYSNRALSYPNRFLEKVTEHWVPATKDNIKVGSKVKMIDEECHRSNPWCVPDVGTVGTVTELGLHTHLVQWPAGTTSITDEWYCNDTYLEVLLCE